MTVKEGVIKFGLVGCGRIGARHAKIISEENNAQLVAVCDLKKPDLGDPLNHIPFYYSIDEMLKAHPEMDVVSIATPNGLHASQAITVLEHGHHVIIEKPIALRKADAEKVIYTALHKSRHVFGVMQNRYSPPSVWIKDLVRGGKLGRINMVQVNCYWNRDERYYSGQTWHGTRQMDGGTIYTQFSHFIDIMYWLFGDIENINTRLTNFNHNELTEFEDSGIVSFDFVNGGMGVINFSTSCWDQNFESSITVIAENGTVKIGGQYMDKVEYCHIKDYTMPEISPSNPPNDYGAYKGSASNHHQLFTNVINVLRGRDSITTNALEGLKVVEIIERIYKST